MSMNFKKKEVVEKKSFNPVVKFENVGDVFVGKVSSEVRTEMTSFGESSMVDMVTPEGELFTLILTSNIKYYDWKEMFDKWYEVAYTDNKKNSKTKRTYKEFTITELEVE